MLGLSEERIDDACPQDLEPYDKSYEMRMKDSDYKAYMQGRYFVEAIACTIGNIGVKSHSKAYKYPEKPFYEQYEDEQKKRIDYSNLSEEEKQVEIDKLFSMLGDMAFNFKNSKKKKS